MKEQMLHYYATLIFNPHMPGNTGFRHFRFKDINGTWRKVPDKVHNRDELVKWLVKLAGIDVFYGTATWMNPQKISSKGNSGSYFVADNLLLGHDLVFDVDAKDPWCAETLDDARKVTNNIYEAMKEFSDRFEFDYMAFTGKKGFRVAYKDKKLELPEDPRARIEYVEKDRKLFIDALLQRIEERKPEKRFYKVDTHFDRKITENVMCVVRVVGTGHSGTGFISTKIQTLWIRENIERLLTRIPHVGKERPVIPTREMIQEEEQENSGPQPRLLQSDEDASGLASSSPTPNRKHFFSNRVLGIKRGYIPIFAYQKAQKGIERELKKLQERHNLGHIYVFEEGESIYALSLKIMQRRNLQKVLNESSSRTKWTFLRHKKIFAPWFMTFKKKLRGERTGHLSLGHFFYVEANIEPTKGLYAGWEKIELVTGLVEKENGGVEIKEQ